MKLSIFPLLLFLSILTSCEQLPWSEPNHDAEIRAEYEASCWTDSTGSMTSKEKQLSDSMLNKGFEFFSVDHIYYYSDCKDVLRPSKEELCLSYFRKRPVYKSLQAKSEDFLLEITKHVFSNYVSNETIMKYDSVHVKDNFFHVYKVFSRKELFDLCDFDIISDGKNQWKRIPFK